MCFDFLGMEMDGLMGLFTLGILRRWRRRVGTILDVGSSMESRSYVNG